MTNVFLCSSEIGKERECLNCNKGYFLPENNKTSCVKCDINGCLQCSGDENNKLCMKCQDDYEMNNGKCVERKCELGENEKCFSCRTEIGREKECLNCNEGYFLSEDYKTSCVKCDINGCLQCSGGKNNKLCIKCKDGYELNDGKCFKEFCEIGEKEKCFSCRPEIGREKECLNCNEGYFLPEDYKTSCEKCDLNGCSQCFGFKNNKLCIKCQDGYELKCVEESCIIGENEKCSSCRTEIGRKKECLTCNQGFYIKENANPTKCFRCPIPNCKQCYSYLGQEYCKECKSTFEEIKNNNGLIEDCSCPKYFKYYNGSCVENNNWIEAEYDVKCKQEPLNLLDTLFINLELNEIEAYINNSIILLEKYSPESSLILYQCENNGLYKVKINIKKTIDSMHWMFANNKQIKTIRFLQGFDSSLITDMSYMFASSSIETIDMKYIYAGNLIYLSGFLSFAELIKSIDISNLNTFTTKYMAQIFHKLPYLQELDLSSFDTSNVEYCLIMIHEIPPNCTIKISNQFTKCREEIPYSNRLINIDDINCNNFENCEKCDGSKNTLKCIKCKIGYELIDNRCYIPKCELGKNEKCLTCNNITGKEDECSKCNDGYYLSTRNSLNKKICSRCNIDGCKKCDNSGNCQECNKYYKAFKNQDNGEITNCIPLCELGRDNKCLTCNERKGHESECGRCNEGYKLINDKCKEIENSFIAIYNIKSTNSYTPIMCISENNIKLSDFDMYVNGNKVEPIRYIIKKEWSWKGYENKDYVGYKFPKLGNNEVKIIFYKTFTDMKYLFAECNNLINIEFNETFDTSHVQCMSHMFYRCDNLININFFI